MLVAIVEECVEMCRKGGGEDASANELLSEGFRHRGEDISIRERYT